MSVTQVPTAGLIIRASAGSGKTYQLALRILNLLAHDVKPEEILATTFTKKAAAEIYQRVIALLWRIASGDPLAEVNLTRARASEILDTLLTASTTLQVTTLDAWYNKIALRFSMELGLPANWQVLSESGRQKQMLATLQDVLQRVPTEDVALIIRALSHEESPKFIIDTLLDSFSALAQVSRGTPSIAWQWLQAEYPTLDHAGLLKSFLTFEFPKTKTGTPNKNWQNAIEKLTGTLRSFGWKDFFKDGLVGKFLEEQAYYRIPFPDVSSAIMQSAVGIVAEELRRLYSQQLAVAGVTSAIFEQALETQESLGGISFDRIKVILSKYIASSFGDSLRYRLDNRTRHLLFDEFQDTSWTDWAVLEPFVLESLSQEQQDRSLFVVGDTKQAIYAWRGGTRALFDKIDQLSEGRLESLPLTLSRRSSKAVIALVNAVFDRLAQTELSTAVIDDFGRTWITHQTTRSEEGFAEIITVPDSLEENETEAWAPCERAALEKLQQCRQKFPSASVGILFRSNKDIFSFSRLLTAHGITHSAEGGTFVSQRILVQVLEAAIRLVVNPSDSVSAFLVNKAKLSRTALAEIFCRSGLRKCIEYVIAQLKPVATMDEQACFSLIRQQVMLHDLSIDDFLSELSGWKLDRSDKTTVRLLTMHSSKGLEFDQVFLCSLNAPLRRSGGETELWMYRPDPAGAPSRISFSFPKAITNVDHRFAEIYAQQENEGVNEALNLLYVALTRAKQALHIFVPEKLNPNSFADIISRTATERVFGDERTIEITSEVRPNIQRSRPAQFVPPKAGVALPVVKRASASRAILSVVSQDGTTQHSLFAQVHFLSTGSMQEIAEKNVQLATCNPSGYSRGLEFLNSDFAKELLSADRYSTRATVLNEKKLLSLVGESLLTGTIDRLVLLGSPTKPDAAEIMDFKSNREMPGADSDLLKEYNDQLRSYRQLVSAVFNIPEEKITCTLVFTSIKEIYTIER